MKGYMKRGLIVSLIIMFMFEIIPVKLLPLYFTSYAKTSEKTYSDLEINNSEETDELQNDDEYVLDNFNKMGVTKNLESDFEIDENGVLVAYHGEGGKVVLPEGITSIGDNAFKKCITLREIKLSEGITSIGRYAFSGCISLTKIDLSEEITSIENFVFMGCNRLTEITLPEGIKNIGYAAFKDCSKLTEINLPKGITTIGEDAFEGCSNLTKITLPEGITSIDAFASCSSLTEINLPKGITSIGDFGFAGCSSLTNITLPEGITSIENFAFLGCNSLANITLPEEITSIGVRVFADCSSLRKITLPEGITSIGDGAFAGCSSLTIYCYAGSYAETYAKEYDIPYQLIDVLDEGLISNFDIQVYSSFPNCMIGVEQTCAILPVMAKDDDIIKNEKGWNFKVENNNIAEIQEYIDTDFGTATRIIGKSTGTTKLHITHIPTGKTIDIPIFVNENMMIYNLSDVMAFGKEKGIRNSGIYTTNYTATSWKNGGYYVSFDAYNGCSLEAAVEIYNSKNQLIEVKKIDKFDRYQTGIEEVFKDGWNLVFSYLDGSIDSYTNSLYTKKTHIDEFYVPEGGYFIITNNMIDSLSVNIFNTIDIAFWMYATVKDITAEPAEKVKDDTKLNICREVINRILIGSGEHKDALTKFQKKLKDSINKKISIDTITLLTTDLLNGAEVFFPEFDINLINEFIKAMTSTGISIAEDIFKDYSGPSGKVLGMIFKSNAYLNRMMQVADIIKTSDSKGVRIDVSAESKLISNGIIVENSDGSKFTDTDLIVVDITEEETSTYIIYLDSVSQVKIYNISLYQDSVIIQPENKIRLKVPLPATYNKDKCIIYRVEEDNSLTDMDAIYSDGYLVFETDHLSNYILYEKFSYSVTFDGNGALSGSMNSLNDCLKDTQYVLPANSYTRNNYKFNGWNTSPDGTGISFTNGCTISNLTEVNDGTIVLYAQWTESSNDSGNIDKEENNTEADREDSEDEDDFDSNNRITNTIVQPVGKWVKDSTGWWYQNIDNTYPANQWQFINGKWYFFNKAGYMVTGWILSNHKWYYLGADGAMLENSWLFYKNQWYFLKGGSGDMATGWILWKNQWYYLNKDGSMKTGWLLEKNIWYYLNQNGDMAVDCTTPDGYQVNQRGEWIP